MKSRRVRNLLDQAADGLEHVRQARRGVAAVIDVLRAIEDGDLDRAIEAAQGTIAIARRRR